MKNTLLLLLTLSLIPVVAFAGDKIVYTYDAAGNRISRQYVVDLQTRSATVSPEIIDSVSTGDELGDRKIVVYPNPTKGNLTVNISGGNQEDKANLILYSSQGTLLQNINATVGSIPVNLSAYPSGYYILRVDVGKKTIEFKIIKQ